MVTYTIKNYQPEMLESWLRCRALAYMRSSFQDEITAEKGTVSDDTGMETYYVGKSENIKQLTDVHKVVTENVYTLEL